MRLRPLPGFSIDVVFFFIFLSLHFSSYFIKGNYESAHTSEFPPEMGL